MPSGERFHWLRVICSGRSSDSAAKRSRRWPLACSTIAPATKLAAVQ